MTVITNTLNEIGITLAQLLAFILAIAASYLSAKFGASESRRQYRERDIVEKRESAVVLIHSLNIFADECERRLSDLDLIIQSRGHAGKRHSIADLDLALPSYTNTAKISAKVAARIVELGALKAKVDQAFKFSLEFDHDEDETAEKVLSWLALLILRARFTVDVAAAETKLPLTKMSEGQMEYWRKLAFKHSHELESEYPQ